MYTRLFPEFSTIFTSQSQLYNYLYGGKGVVTLESPSGIKHTYTYERPRNLDQFPEDIIFVYSLHMDDQNKSNQTKFYLGMIECDNFRITRNSRFNYNSPVVKGAFYIEKLRKSQQFLEQSPMIIYHEGVCGLCGSKISSDISRACGFGRHCRSIFSLPKFDG